MSVWIFKSPFTAEEEQNLAQHTRLPLPFNGLPDLSGIDSEEKMRRLMMAMHLDAPPETIVRQADMYWGRFGELALGDLILLPLSNRKIALAEVTTRYVYAVEDGNDVHYTEVHWLEFAIPRRKLHTLRTSLDSNVPMQLIEHAQARKPVYALLKRPYNRFVKFQVICSGLFILAELLYVVKMF